MGYRRATARFHVESGPDSLFQRVQFKMSGERTLGFHGEHFRQRALERVAPIEEIRNFSASEWNLVTAEVDVAKGKFINSSWRREINGKDWFIVIGLGDVILTVVQTSKSGIGPRIVTRGEVFDFVQQINEDLMSREAS